MKYSIIILCSLILLIVPVKLTAQAPVSEHTLRLDDPSSMPEASIEQAAWIAGHWKGDGFGGQSEEMWSEPAAGAMMGMYRIVRADTVWFYEFLTIVEENQSLVLRLKHFHSDLTGWESKDKTIDFPLVKIEENTMWFHGLTFKQTGENNMTIYLRLGQNGNYREEVFNMERVKPPSND